MSGRLLSASPFLVATNSQFPRVEAWKKFRRGMNIINEQARANSKKTQHDASANVLNITLEKSIFLQERKNNNYNTDKLPKGHCKTKLKKTMKMKPLTNAEDNWRWWLETTNYITKFTYST